MGSVTLKISLPKDNPITLFVAGDWHSKHLNIPTFTRLIQVAQTVPYEQRWLILNGDVYDCWYGMKKDESYKEWKKRKGNAEDFFIPEFDAETKIVNDILDAVQSVFSRVIWVGGNHDDPRLQNIIDVVPVAYKHYFDIEKACHLYDRKIEYIKYNDWLMIGDNLCLITHGMFCNKTCHKMHWEITATNTIFSHIHKCHMLPFRSITGAKVVASTPAMCDRDPDYMKNKNSDWDNGWLTLTITPDPLEFSITPFIVRNNMLTLVDGRVI